MAGGAKGTPGGLGVPFECRRCQLLVRAPSPSSPRQFDKGVDTTGYLDHKSNSPQSLPAIRYCTGMVLPE